MRGIGGRDTVYGPNRGKLWSGVAVCAGFVALVGLASAPNLAAWVAGRAPLQGGTVWMLLSVLLFLAFGGIGLVSIARGLPRLTLTAKSIKLESLFRSSEAAWSSLAAFEMTSYRVRYRRVRLATAVLVGSNASGVALRRKKFSIQDAFEVSLEEILAEAGRRQAEAHGAHGVPVVDSDAAEQNFGVEGYTCPWLTFGILGLLIVMFLAEQVFAIGSVGPLLSPSVQTLVALGAVNHELVVTHGEWYRLFTAPLLHGNLTHIALNGVAFFLVGYPLERLIGRVWFLALFLVGALGGSLMSITVNPSALTSVGASGAIMGLFAAALVLSFRLPSGGRARTQLQVRTLRVLIPSLLPLTTAGGAGQVDYGAHLGGALSCAAAALILFWTWRDDLRLPRFLPLAGTLAAMGVVVTLGSVAASAATYDKYRNLVALIPAEQLPKTEAAINSRASDLLRHYPDDPRAHLFMGVALADQGNLSGADYELRLGVQGATTLGYLFGPQFVAVARGTLAEVLFAEGQRNEAREAARGLCQPGVLSDDAMRKSLADEQLCE